MVRRYRGEDVALPVDLSEVVRRTIEPWPLRAVAGSIEYASEVAAARGRAALRRLKPGAQDQRVLLASLVDAFSESSTWVPTLRAAGAPLAEQAHRSAQQLFSARSRRKRCRAALQRRPTLSFLET